MAGRHSHVKRVINQEEAAMVTHVFALSAAGTGYTRIAKLLNEERAPAPRPKAGRPAGWSPSTVKVIVNRRLSLGEATWNRTRKRDSSGSRRCRVGPEAGGVGAAPELRVVAEQDWAAAQGRLENVRARMQSTGAGFPNRRARDIDSHYLLSGFARCAVCGGSLGVTTGSHSSNRRRIYGCIAYLKRGKSVCRTVFACQSTASTRLC